MAEVICPRCKTPNRDTARFCADCGALLIDDPNSASQPPAGSPRKKVSTPAPDTVLEGRYHIENELGRGGFGAVFKALDLRLNKPVAVKENLDASPEAQRQFAREATVLANLAHPNLPRVIDHFSVPDLGQYLVMDFVSGEDLNTMIARDGVIPLEAAVSWISQVADALDYLHSQQPAVLHRDIKPANIRITRSSGPYGRAMLVDFGLVKHSDASIKTTMGARAITPGYAPPEQYGVGYTDARTDIYALGATLYAAITGREPVESVQRMAGKVVLPAQSVNPAIPASLSRIIERAMALEPGQRYQSASDFRAALHAAQVEIRAGAGASKPAVPGPTALHPNSAPRPVSGPRPGGQAEPPSRPRVVQPGAPPAGAGAYVATPPASRPTSHPTPSQPVSRPVGAGGKKALGATAIVIVILCIALAAGSYALYSYSNQAGATGATRTVEAQATAMFQLAGTATAQATLFAPQGGNPASSLIPVSALQSTPTPEATATENTQVEATSSAATARVEATRAAATASAATKTYAAQATLQTIEQYVPDEAREKLRFAVGPKSGSMKHDSDQYIEDYEISGLHTNFVLEVTFINPYASSRGAWDYGVLFRHSGKNEQYRLVVRSNQRWELDDGNNTTIMNGSVKNLNTGVDAENKITLVCLKDRAWFYLNGELVKEVKVASRQDAGGLSLATGFFDDSEITGETVGFTDLMVWTIITP